MRDYAAASPLKVLANSSRKELGPGNLGVFIARAGAGKTACLIHTAFNSILKQEKVVHISLKEGSEKVISFYNVMYQDLTEELDIIGDHDFRKRLDNDRMILVYLKKSFETERLKASLRNLVENLQFYPKTLIIDGLDFENSERSIFKNIKEIAEDFSLEVWFSALSHRHIAEVNERGIPYPCHKLDDLFDLIIQLQPEHSGIFLRLLKDHDNPTITDITIRLNPKTFLALDPA